MQYDGWYFELRCIHHPDTTSPYVLEEDDTPTFIKLGVFFGTQIFLGPIGLVLSRTQTFLFNIFNLAYLLNGLCGRNVHMCALCHTWKHAYIDVCVCVYVFHGVCLMNEMYVSFEFFTLET